MIHPIIQKPTPKGYTRLSDRDVRFASMPGAAVVVSCAICEMTMHANSPGALVHHATNDIVCVGCATPPDATVRPMGVPHA